MTRLEDAWAKCKRVLDAARAEYDRATAPASAKYKRATDAAWAEYDRAIAAAGAEYARIEREVN